MEDAKTRCFGDQGQTEEPYQTYVGCKIIRAAPMDLMTFNREQGKPPCDEVAENPPGYKVIYPDGYESWSPKAVFEEAYRLLNPREKLMCA